MKNVVHKFETHSKLTLSKEKMVMKKMMVLATAVLLMFPALGFTADDAKPAVKEKRRPS